MKKLLLILFLLGTLSGYSQIQQGVVKTIGRPNKPSVVLSDVVIRPQGDYNKVITDKLGGFKIVFPDKKEGDPIALVNIYKKGYALKDEEVIGRQYGLSTTVPIIIQMIDLKQYEEDKKHIEDKAYRLIEEKYKSKIADLEKLKAKGDSDLDDYKKEYVPLPCRAITSSYR